MPSTSSQNVVENENPITQQAELQARTIEVIGKCISMGIGKQVFESDRQTPVGVIIPEGLEQGNLHNLALVYCTDGSLVEIYVDNYTNKYINPETMDFVLLPSNRDSHFLSTAVAVAATINNLGQNQEPKGDCRVVCDIDKDPDKIITLLQDTIQRRRQELTERLEKRGANQARANDILENL